jgi:tetratricopeptide (TPR) repeat protein
MDLKLERELSPILGETIGDVWPFLAVLMGSLVPQNYSQIIDQLPPAQLNSKISQAVQRIIEVVAEKAPLALAFEDLHWADQSSITLIQSLMLSSERIPLLLVMLFRPERNKPAWNLKLHAETEFAHRYLELTLSPLDEGSSRTLVENLLDIPQFPRSLRHLIQRKAEGNPFFVEELIHDLVERQVLVRRNGAWELSGDIETLGVPDKVEEVIQARLDRLSPAERNTLQSASVIGRRFSVRELEMITADHGALMEHLLQLQRADLVRESTRIQEHEYIFRHVLVQETTYQTLLKEQRKELHKKAGEALEILFPDRVGENGALIGRHFELAGLPEKAIDYYLQTGRRAAKLASNQEAVALLNQGLRLLDESPDTTVRARRELELLLALGPPLQLLKGFSSSEVERVYDRARVLSGEAQDIPQLFPAIWGLWTFYEFRGAGDFAIEVGEKLRSMAERAQDSTFLLQAHHTLWTTRFFEGSFLATLKHAETGLAVYDAHKHRPQAFMYGSHDPAMCSHGLSSIALLAMGFPDQALREGKESLLLAKELPHPFNIWMSHIFAAWHGHIRRDVEMTRVNAGAAIAAAAKLSPPFLHLPKVLQSWAQVQLGAEDLSPSQLEQSAEEVLKGWRGRFRAYTLAILAESYQKIGRYKDALVSLDEALEAADRASEEFYAAEMHRLKGELLQSEGAGDTGAERHFQIAIEVAQGQRAKLFELRAATSLSRIWSKKGRQDEARQLLTPLVGWFTEGHDTLDLKEAKALLS